MVGGASLMCDECGAPATVHSAGLRRLVRDLDMGPAQTFVHVKCRRVWCPDCGRACVEKLSFVGPSQRITQRMARYVLHLTFWRATTTESVPPLEDRANSTMPRTKGYREKPSVSDGLAPTVCGRWYPPLHGRSWRAPD